MRQFKNTKNITERSNISVNKYLKEVSRYPMVTVDEEVILAQKIRQGGKEADKARQRLVEANLRFVISVANQYHQHNMDLSDLISEGNIGLIKAAERFDETRGSSSYRMPYGGFVSPSPLPSVRMAEPSGYLLTNKHSSTYILSY